jgi:hypothetical protein
VVFTPVPEAGHIPVLAEDFTQVRGADFTLGGPEVDCIQARVEDSIPDLEAGCIRDREEVSTRGLVEDYIQDQMVDFTPALLQNLTVTIGQLERFFLSIY